MSSSLPEYIGFNDEAEILATMYEGRDLAVQLLSYCC
jgi:hypothetical protein